MGIGGSGEDPGRAHRAPTWIVLAVAVVAVLACGRAGDRHADRPAYQPRLRTFTVTAVPLLVKEQQDLFPFLKKDFASGGVLEGKEVYSFQPSALTAYRGDTLRFVLVNPEDDLHTFILDGHGLVRLPGQSTVVDTVVASRVGLFRFLCDLPAHSPFMYGQLVVLPDRDARSGSGTGSGGRPSAGD